jgi:DUF971 family protein
MTQLPETIENRTVQGVLALRWPDGRATSFTHAQLRAACPCSECRARRRAGETVQAGEDVRLEAIEPVGAYALNLAFSDGHRRGIYPFQMLAELALARRSPALPETTPREGGDPC